MKTCLLTLILALCSLNISAQGGADRITGVYLAKLSRNDAKVKVFRHQDGYRMQIFWLKETKYPDGKLKVDSKNPDTSKRSTPMSQVVLVDKVTYEDGIWKNGRIYDPTSGKSYKVELSLDGRTLEVKGKLGPFSKCMYWTKVE